MRYLYRCSKEKCKVRRALKRRADTYLRVPKCKICNSYLRLDTHRMKEKKGERCLCDGYHFPHRKGSLWCRHYTGELTDEMMQDRYQHIPKGI